MPKIRQLKKTIDLQELKKEIVKAKQAGEKLVLRNKRLQEELDEWDDWIILIEKKIFTAQEETGLPRQEIEAFDAFTDMLS